MDTMQFHTHLALVSYYVVHYLKAYDYLALALRSQIARKMHGIFMDEVFPLGTCCLKIVGRTSF